MNVNNDSNLQQLAGVWGFHYFPPNDYHFDALLCCKNRVDFVFVGGPGVAPPESANRYGVQQPMTRRASIINARTNQPYYAIRDGWLVAYRGTEVRRVIWMPPNDVHTLDDVLVRSTLDARFLVIRLLHTSGRSHGVLGQD